MISRFYLTAFAALATWKTLSVTLHYFSDSPWGGPLVMSPDRLLPDTLFIEWGLLAIACLSVGVLESLIKSQNGKSIWRIGFLSASVVYGIFCQFDQEVVRWLGQHMTLSYIQNYIGARDGQMAGRILSGDVFWTTIAGVLMVLTVPTAYFAWWKDGRTNHRVSARWIASSVIFAMLMTSAHQWFRPSEKRWRRIRPAVLVIAKDTTIAVLGLEKPKDPEQAEADFVALTRDGKLAVASANEPQEYPIWRDDNLGSLSVDQFKALPLEERPDIVFIVFETLRGWNTGLVPNEALVEGSPRLNEILESDANFFPYMHSAGFPSVEGCLGMHLGVWPHFRKIFLSDYGHIRTKGFPEILRDFGYSTHALLGADPSFSNFTPWIERWYKNWEYNPAVHHDGPLVDRFIERHAETEGDQPRLMMMWTATTHPPYDVPDSENVDIAGDNESRFMQALAYSDKHIARLINHLKTDESWSRTVVVVVGDHAQPTPEQWLMADSIGNLTPGHTWTILGITGGWHGLPQPQRFDTPVSHIDIAPTLLSLLNIKAGNHFMGRNLLAKTPEELAATDARPVVSFRYGDVAWQEGNQRIQFRLDSDALLATSFDLTNTLEYGALPGAEIRPATVDIETLPIDRWRDAIRFYSILLDENRLMPPVPGEPVAKND